MPQLPSFVELPSFERFREDYLADDEYKDFQLMLIGNPKAGRRCDYWYWRVAENTF